MAKKKISQFKETTSLANDDILPVVVNAATVPASRKISTANVRKELLAAISDPVLINSGAGINFGTADESDGDIDILTLNVADTPKLWWDDSADSFVASKGLRIADGPLTLGAAFQIAASGSNYCARSDVNKIDDGTQTNSILGGGAANYINAIGSPGLPYGIPPALPPEWEADAAYPDNAATVATICGGYDHICNQIAGLICGGGHNFIKYNAQGHSVIVGGSFNLVSSGRSAIVGGTLNAIHGPHIQGFIGSGTGNRITDGDFATIVNGYLCRARGNHAIAWETRLLHLPMVPSLLRTLAAPYSRTRRKTCSPRATLADSGGPAGRHGLTR